MKRIFLFVIIVFHLGCVATNQFSNQKVALPSGEAKVIYLVGDAGKLDNEEENNVINAVKKDIAANTDLATIVFLGDNIYPKGLPHINHDHRQKAEKILKSQLDLIRGNDLKAYFIPGNHDWQNFDKNENQDASIKRQADFINNYNKDHQAELLPDSTRISYRKLDEKTILIFFDTEWWLREYAKSDGVSNEIQNVSTALDNLIEDHKDQNIIVFGHHPLYSNGNHGGYYSFKQHIFPLTEFNSILYLPLPIIGSLFPIYNHVFKDSQDIGHTNYKKMKSRLEDSFELAEDVIYISGHEHNMQFFQENDDNYIISGSGSKSAYAKKGGQAIFTSDQRGFAKLYLYASGEIWIEFLSLTRNVSSNYSVVYRYHIK
jgi:predicted phosphodiesterase